MSGLLVITAHPDDEVLIAGGTLAACAAGGVDTGVVSLTRGELGPIADPALASGETLGKVRRAELIAACAELGAGFVECWEWPDGELRWSDADMLVGQLVDLLERRSPEAVITFGPDGLYYHPDHIATYELVVAAAGVKTTTPVVYRSIWPKPVMESVASELRRRRVDDGLWEIDPEAFGTDELEGCFSLDVRQFARRKIRALRAHRTQVGAENVFATCDPVVRELIETEWFAPVLGDGWLQTRALEWLTT